MTSEDCEEFETEGSWRREDYGMLPERMLQDRGSLLKEDANQLSEYEAMHEENFLSSWLREDVEGEKAESSSG